MQLKEIKEIFHKELGLLYPKEEIDSFFSLLMKHHLNLQRFTLVLQPNYVISKEEEPLFFDALTQLKKEEPIQYILGQVSFMDFIFKVNEHVLIPRPETEELVQWLVDECLIDCSRDLKILDIGTGSGCIAITLAKAFPNSKIVALDVSSQALTVAEENAKLNDVQIRFVQGDILNLSKDLEEVFDVIVSNPPYVREQEKKQMNNNVKKHEPGIALFVPDEDALKFYSAIVTFAKTHLNPNGKLFFEINQYLAEETQQLLVDNDFIDVELRKDIFGNFRMLRGIWTSH